MRTRVEADDAHLLCRRKHGHTRCALLPVQWLTSGAAQLRGEACHHFAARSVSQSGEAPCTFIADSVRMLRADRSEDGEQHH